MVPDDSQSYSYISLPYTSIVGLQSYRSDKPFLDGICPATLHNGIVTDMFGISLVVEEKIKTKTITAQTIILFFNVLNEQLMYFLRI